MHTIAQLQPMQDHTSAPRRSPPLHVAMVDEELPYPPTSGKRIRTLNLTLAAGRKTASIGHTCVITQR